MTKLQLIFIIDLLYCKGQKHICKGKRGKGLALSSREVPVTRIGIASVAWSGSYNTSHLTHMSGFVILVLVDTTF